MNISRSMPISARFLRITSRTAEVSGSTGMPIPNLSFTTSPFLNFIASGRPGGTPMVSISTFHLHFLILSSHTNTGVPSGSFIPAISSLAFATAFALSVIGQSTP